jgi:hypothetical protein
MNLLRPFTQLNEQTLFVKMVQICKRCLIKGLRNRARQDSDL